MIPHLKTNFKATMGDANVYVGLHNTWDLPHWNLFVDQQYFTETLLVKYGFHNVSKRGGL